MDLVIPLRKSDDNCRELKFLLRSAELFMENLNNVVIIGYKPDWICRALHLPAGDVKNGNKDANIILKLQDACKWKEVEKPFLWSADDHVFTSPVTEEEQMIPGARIWEHHDYSPMELRNTWVWRKKHTYEVLKGQSGRDPLYYDVHAPQPMDDDFPAVMHTTSFIQKPGMLVNSTYLNLSDRFCEPVDNRVSRVIRNNMDRDELEELWNTCKYISYSENGYTKQLKSFLNDKFREKSSYEQ